MSTRMSFPKGYKPSAHFQNPTTNPDEMNGQTSSGISAHGPIGFDPRRGHDGFRPQTIYPAWNHFQPAVFRPDAGGWYAAPSMLPTYQPPPPHTVTAFPNPIPPPLRPITTTTNLPDRDIHDFWKGKLAPLPESSSPQNLLAMYVPQPVQIKPPLPAKTPRNRSRRRPGRGNVENPAAVPENGKPEIDVDKNKENMNPRSDFQFDKYAEVFVPKYLKDIQRQHHHLVPLPPVPVFPPLSYLQVFLPARLMEELRKPRSASLLSSPPPPTAPTALGIETYHSHWAALLALELDTLSLDKQQIVLWKIGIKIGVWKDAEFVLFVPGIRENYPRLDVGDLVHMRQVLEAEQRGSGLAFEGRVVNLVKREGFIHLHCPALKQHIQTYLEPSHSQIIEAGHRVFSPEDDLGLLFNVSFMLNARPLCMMETAAATLGQALSTNTEGHNLARQWLFPEPEDLEQYNQVYTRKPGVQDGHWHDGGLNSEQRLAASSIALHQSPVPFLISGPPGTGKTRTVVETVLQILRVRPEACILLCAPSHPATDTLVMRLRDVLKPSEMLRLNDQNRTFAEVPVEIMQYCYPENGKFALPPWKTLMKYRVVVCSCSDASILVAAQCTNMSLGRLEEDITSSIHPGRQTQEVSPHWTHLLIDEAAQGSEPELLIPISVVLTQPRAVVLDEDSPILRTRSHQSVIPQLILCGDPNQLGPIVTSDLARVGELDVSLLERLFERPLYANTQAKPGTHRRALAQRALSFRPVANLVKNYRSHPVILMPPSALFYGDSLEPNAENGTMSWSGMLDPQLPLMFIGNESKEECVDERATWYNSGEINMVVETIKSLLSEKHLCSPPLRPADIGVMTPWREQVWKLRERLRKESLRAVDVGNIEDYQGRESRVVIISCVRSSGRFVEEDKKKGLGLILECKRMNVAITRAKELLIVIGNGALLSEQDPYWMSFLQFTLRNKLYVGPDLGLESDGNFISRLESELMYARVNGVDEEEQGVMMAGGLAREVLRE